MTDCQTFCRKCSDCQDFMARMDRQALSGERQLTADTHSRNGH